MTGIESKIAVWMLKQAYQAVQNGLSSETKGPVDLAIDRTCEHFSQFEDLGTTLRDWINSGFVSNVLSRFLTGLDAVDDVPLRPLVSSLIGDGGFYVSDTTSEEASAIVLSFINALRDALLTVPHIALLYIENRNEARHHELMTAVASTQKALPPLLVTSEVEPHSLALKKRFDRAKSALERRPKEAGLLFEVLVEELRSDPDSSKPLLVKALTNQASALLQLGEIEKSCSLLEAAHDIEKSNLTELNLGIVALLQNRPDDCLVILESLEGTSSDKPEFWAAKLTALFRLGRGSDAVEVARHLPASLPEADRKELLGTSLVNVGEFTEASQVLKDAVDLDSENPDFWFRFADSIYVPILQSRNLNPVPALLADRDEKERLRVGLDALTKAETLAAQRGREKLASDAQVNRGTVLMALGELRSAADVFQGLSNAADPPPAIWRSLGTCLLLTERADEAVSALRRAPDSEKHLGTETVLFHALVASGNAEEALSFAQERAITPVAQNNLEWHLLVAEALRATKQFAKSEAVLESLRSQFNDSPEFLLAIAEHYDYQGQWDAADLAYQKAMENGASSLSGRARLLYSSSLYGRKEYEKTVAVLAPIVPLDVPCELLGRYLYALYCIGQYNQVLTVVDGLQSKGLDLPEPIAEIAASSSEFLYRVESSRKFYEYLTSRYGNKPKHLARLAVCLYRIGEHERAADILTGVRRRIDNASDLLMASEASAAIGDHIGAMECALAAMRAAPNEPRVHLTFAWRVMIAGKHNKEKVPQEYIDAHIDVLQNFNTRFPESKLLQKFTFNDPEEGIRQILETVAERQKSVSEILRLYVSKRLPVPVLSALTSQHELETYLGLCNDKEMRIYMAHGNDQESKEFQTRCDKSAAGELVLSLSGILTWALLEKLDVLKANFKCVVAQSTVDEIQETLSRMAAQTDGYFHLQRDGERYIRVDVTPEDVSKLQSFITRILEFARDDCRVSGLSAHPSEAEQSLGEKLRLYNLHTALLARELGMPVLSDDGPLWEIFANLYGTQQVCTQAAWQHLTKKTVVSEDEYLKVLSRLLTVGYTFIRIQRDEFYRVLEKESFVLNPIVQAAFETFGIPEVSLESATQVGAWVLGSLFLESLPLQTKRNLAFFVLRCITQSHGQTLVLVRIRALLYQRMSRLASQQLKLVFDVISDFEQSSATVPPA